MTEHLLPLALLEEDSDKSIPRGELLPDNCIGGPLATISIDRSRIILLLRHQLPESQLLLMMIKIAPRDQRTRTLS